IHTTNNVEVCTYKVQTSMQSKRIKLRIFSNETQRRPKGEELTVQRLSAHVSGKAQKYTHMGPREFVPFPEKLEFNIGNIKSACLKHFAPTIGSDVVCDILTGEQGPSCKCHNQIPDLKVIHKRKAIDSLIDSGAFDVDDWEPPKPSIASHLETKSSPNKFRKPGDTVSADFSSQSKHIPKSLSISDMIKLIKVNKLTATTLVKLYQFDMEMRAWSKIHTEVEFLVEKIFHGETDGGEYVAVEEFIPGCFTKYINNTGLSSVSIESANIIGLKAECLVHFSYQKSGKQLMVVDIQGNGYDLFDPEIASTELVDADMNYLYCTGNLSDVAISAFIRQHKCNRYCVLAGRMVHFTGSVADFQCFTYVINSVGMRQTLV
ncbi:transient receptor potential cation channel subfamily M member 6-like, partial [Paramuricea clavata]